MSSTRSSRATRRAKADQPFIAMKSEGHPTLNNVCFLDIGTGRRYLTKSTMKSARKEQIEGQEYFVIARDVTMDSHPAYTGEKRLVDTAGRVEKFTTKFKRTATAKK
jgi:large subunit ribosomal protein L31